MNLNQEVTKIVRNSLTELRDDIISQTSNAGQVASGRTIRSLVIEDTEGGGVLKGRKYIDTLETGRKDGKVPKSFNEIIKQWILDKGIPFDPVPYKRIPSLKWHPKYTPEERGLMSISGAIAHKIATEGTTLHKSGGRKDIITYPKNKIISDLKLKIGGIFKLEIKDGKANR